MGPPGPLPLLQDTLASLLAHLDSLESIQCGRGWGENLDLPATAPAATCGLSSPHTADPAHLYSLSLPQHNRLTPRLPEPLVYTALEARLYTRPTTGPGDRWTCPHASLAHLCHFCFILSTVATGVPIATAYAPPCRHCLLPPGTDDASSRPPSFPGASSLHHTVSITPALGQP